LVALVVVAIVNLLKQPSNCAHFPVKGLPERYASLFVVVWVVVLGVPVWVQLLSLRP